MERKAAFKSEYLDGYITAMSGDSREHNRIAGNFYRKISDQLENRPCEAFISDLRVCISSTGLYTYPMSSSSAANQSFWMTKWIHS